jgi:hypothetical protein
VMMNNTPIACGCSETTSTGAKTMSKR